MIALIDYGAGNVRSVHKALETVGAEVRLARAPDLISDAEKIVLPGVGAFGDCMASLRRAGLVDVLRQAVEEGKPLLGICVGMQVLFEEGEEMGRHAGLSLLPGRVVRFAFTPHLPLPRYARHPLPLPCSLPQSWGRAGVGAGEEGGRGMVRAGHSLKIPHTGWNQVDPVGVHPLFHDLPPGAWAYFNHAYYCQARPEHILAVTDYGGPFPSVVGQGRVYGIQFHPEKSQETGLHILRNFVERVK